MANIPKIALMTMRILMILQFHSSGILVNKPNYFQIFWFNQHFIAIVEVDGLFPIDEVV